MSYRGLGETYPITLPVVGHTNVEIPVQRITQDAMSYALTDLQLRVKRNLPMLLGIGLGLTAVYLVVKRI